MLYAFPGVAEEKFLLGVEGAKKRGAVTRGQHSSQPPKIDPEAEEQLH